MEIHNFLTPISPASSCSTILFPHVLGALMAEARSGWRFSILYENKWRLWCMICRMGVRRCPVWVAPRRTKTLDRCWSTYFNDFNIRICSCRTRAPQIIVQIPSQLEIFQHNFYCLCPFYDIKLPMKTLRSLKETVIQTVKFQATNVYCSNEWNFYS